MPNKSDKKLSQEVRVVLERLSESDYLSLGKNVKRYKTWRHGGSKKYDEEINKNNIPPSFKKENKVFEVNNTKIEEVSETKHPIKDFSHLKVERLILESNETKVEKDAKKNLKGLIVNNASNKLNPRKRSNPSINYPEKKIKTQNKVEPLLELVPTLIKTEEPEIRLVKKFQRKEKNVVDIEKEKSEESATPTLNIEELIEQNKYATVDISPSYLEMCKSISPSSKKSLRNQIDSHRDKKKVPANEGLVETFNTLTNLQEKDLSPEPTAKSSLNTSKNPEDILAKENYLDGCTEEFSFQTLGQTQCNVVEEAPIKAEFNFKIVESIQEGFDVVSPKDCAEEYNVERMERIPDNTPEEKSLGNLDNEIEKKVLSNEDSVELGHQATNLAKCEHKKEDSSKQFTIEPTRQSLERRGVDVITVNIVPVEVIQKTPVSPEEDSNHEVLKNEIEKKGHSNKDKDEFSHQAINVPKCDLANEDSLSKFTTEPICQTLERRGADTGISPSCHQPLERPDVTPVEPALHLHRINVVLNHETLVMPKEDSGHDVSKNKIEEKGPLYEDKVELSHQAINVLECEDVEEDSINNFTVESCHQTLEMTEVGLTDESATNISIATSYHQPVERDDVTPVEPALHLHRINVVFNHETLEMPKEDSGHDVSKNKIEEKGPLYEDKAELSHQAINVLECEDVEEDSINNFTVESCHQTLEMTEVGLTDESATNISIATSYHQPVERDDVTPVEIAQHFPQNETTTSFMKLIETATSEVLSENIIKVKPPQALGIQSEELSQNSQNISSENRLNILQLGQIKSSRSESRIEEICRLYPIFFTPEARQDIGLLIQILYEASKGLTLDQIKTEQYNETSFMNIQSCGDTFVNTFKGILQLELITFNGDLVKKMIPILYLHMDKAFKRLRPGEDFDFRIIMKQIFKAQRFLCVYDKILDKDYEMFQKVMATFNRWLEDIFTECDISSILKPFVSDVEEIFSEQSTTDSSEDTTMETDSSNIASSKLLKDSNVKNNVQNSTAHNANEEDHNMPLNLICWNVSCSNEAEILCVCRIKAYCSLACQAEDWYDGHQETCRLESDPECLLHSEEKFIDVSF